LPERIPVVFPVHPKSSGNELTMGIEPQSPELTNKNLEDRTPKQYKEIKRAHLINKLNYINFQNGIILVNFRHKKYDRSISIPAVPQPCLDDTLECKWADTDGIRQKLKTHEFLNIHVPDGQVLLMVEADVIDISERGIRISLPETCWQFRVRKVLRHDCRDVKAQMVQNSVVFSGRLIDFNANAFRVEVNVVPPQTFHWISPESTATVIFSDEKFTLYSGECKIIRENFGQRKRFFVLEPIDQSTHRFMPKEYRSFRQELGPFPDIVFRHPITRKMVSLKVISLSGAGFSVEEDAAGSVLLPGMIIPEIELSFANSFKINCIAQVIYQKPVDKKGDSSRVKCGLALLDMDMEDHSKLLALLNLAKNRNSYISNKVDSDVLWNFFFESGFIYPQKYAFVQANKDTIKATYEKLYTQSPSVARHFVYQENGRILGHMSMLRFSGNSWMIHHHAANKNASNKAGLIVLSQIHNYLNDTYRVYSAHLDLVFCYYRTDNKFPNRVFGGATKYMKAPKGCSENTYVYFHSEKGFYNELGMQNPWDLVETEAEDLIELESFYEHFSGGLMLNALGLEADMLGHDDVSKEYRRLGFKRERHLYSLKKEGKLKAVVLLNISDVGLNLSDLVNCMNVIVLDPDDLPKDILKSMLSLLSDEYNQHDIPVLLYPDHYADAIGIPYEKQYNLWVLNLQYLDSYFKFIKRLLRTI